MSRTLRFATTEKNACACHASLLNMFPITCRNITENNNNIIRKNNNNNNNNITNAVLSAPQTTTHSTSISATFVTPRG